MIEVWKQKQPDAMAEAIRSQINQGSKMFNQQKPTPKKIASNMYELELECGTVLISYQTPVAFRGIDGYFKTSKKHSSTTSRQITKWGGKNYPTAPQAFFDNLTA